VASSWEQDSLPLQPKGAAQKGSAVSWVKGKKGEKAGAGREVQEKNVSSRQQVEKFSYRAMLYGESQEVQRKSHCL